METTPTTKFCKYCGQTKPLEDFNVNKNAKDGRHNICRQDNAARQREHRAALKAAAAGLPAPKPVEIPVEVDPSHYGESAREANFEDYATSTKAVPTKTCSKCREDKELDAFPNDKSRKDGKAYVCKTCKSAKR